MKITVEYTADWFSENGDDQHGRVNITTEDGKKIHATWSCRGGMGQGCELLSNTTTLTDEYVEGILDSCDLCQGIGTYTMEVSEDEYGWVSLDVIEWLDPV